MRVAISGLRPLAFIGVAALMLLSMDRSVNPYDEGVIYAGAMRVATGAIPHRDFYANYGPAQFYLLALLFKLTAPSAMIARIWGSCVKAMIVFAAYSTARRIADRPASLLAAACITVWLAISDMTIWPAWPALLFAILSALYVLDFLAGKTTRLTLAGCFVGMATLFRYDFGVLVFVAECSVLTLRSISKASSGSPLLGCIYGDLKGFIAGTAGVVLPLLVWYASVGALWDFVFDVVTFPSAHYAATRSLPFPSLPTEIPASLTDYIVFSPLVVGLGLLTVTLVQWRAATRNSPSFNEADKPLRWSALLFVLLTLAFFLKGIVRVSVIHMTPAIVFTFLLALLIRRPRGKALPSLVVVLATMSLAPPTVFALDEIRFKIGRNADLFEAIRSETSRSWGDKNCRALRCSGRARYMRVDPNEVAAVDYILTHTSVDEVVFSGLAHHDRVFANDAMFYFLSARQPATKWYHFDPGLQTAAPIQREIIADLQATRPRFVLLNSSWDYSREPNASAKSSGVFLLDEFLAQQYRSVAQFGPIVVAELKP